MKQGISLRAMAADATEAVIDVVGVIGWEVEYENLRATIAAIPETVNRVVFDIYSPGGDVWAGNGIVHEIGKMKQVTVARVQVAASMATLIAVACDERSIARNGRFLIHNAWTITQGDAASHEKRAKELRDCENEAVAFYAERSGKKSADEIRALMEEERWLTPSEALEYGFIDAIDDPFKPADFADVRAAIVAAGKWPVALAEIPEDEGEKHDDAGTDGAKGDGGDSAKPPADDDSGKDGGITTEAVEAAKLQAFEEGKAQGLADLTAQVSKTATVVAEWAEKNKAITAKLEASVAEARKLQGERDQARAALEKRTAEVADMTVKLSRLLAGGLTFTPAIESWADALKASGGDYEKARKNFPDVYRAQREHDKASRK